jgi:hypothetical protein
LQARFSYSVDRPRPAIPAALDDRLALELGRRGEEPEERRPIRGGGADAPELAGGSA